jgi:hypothetical protein
LLPKEGEVASEGGWLVATIQRSPVCPGSTILSKLDEKRSERDQEHDVDQPAFVQQKFQHKPNSKQN